MPVGIAVNALKDDRTRHDITHVPFQIIGVSENRSSQPDCGVTTNADCLGMHFIYVDKLADPDVFPDSRPPQTVKPGPDSPSARSYVSHFVQESGK